MTDEFDFEVGLAEGLRARTARATRPFDAAVIARQVIATDRHRGPFALLNRSLRPRSLRWSVIATTVALVLLGAIAAVGALLQEQPPIPPAVVGNGWVAFTLEGTTRNGSSDIYVTRSGVTERPLIGFLGDGVRELCPSFSPDGKRLAYSREPEGGVGGGVELVIAALDADGVLLGDPLVVAPESSRATCPRWSPDSQSVAYIATTPDGARRALWVTRVDGASSEILAYAAIDEAEAFDWSPDGTKVTFVAGSGLWIAPVAGGEARMVHDASGLILGQPDWSPDGLHVAVVVSRFVGDPDGNGGRLEELPSRIVDVRGTEPVIEIAVLSDLAWSPGGHRLGAIRLTIRKGLNWNEVVSMNPDGTDLRVAISDLRTIRGFTWSPDGRQFVVIADDYGATPGLFSISTAGDAGPIPLLSRAYWLEYTSSIDLSWQPVFLQPTSSSTPPRTADPSPAAFPSSAYVVYEWPGARGDSGPGLYAWNMTGAAWMHNVNDEYASASLKFSFDPYEFAPYPTPDDSSGTQVSVAGHTATYREAPPDIWGVRRLQWIVRQLAGRTVYVTVEVPSETTDSALSEIRAIVASLRLERASTSSGFRLVFETLGGWDSG